LPALCAWFAVLVGCLVLVGWWYDLDALKSGFPGLYPMQPNAAVGMILTGLALGLLRAEGAGPGRRRAGQACALVSTLIGALTLLEYVSGRNLGVDQILFPDAAGAAATTAPGRMAGATAGMLVFLGSALLLLDRKPLGGVVPAELLALLAALSSLLPLLGFAYKVHLPYQMGPQPSVALPTALVSVALSLGLLSARPERGWAALVLSDTPGGGVIRRLVPSMAGLFFLLGFLRVQGQRGGLFGWEVGAAIMVLSIAVVSCVLLGWTAHWLNRSDRERQTAEGARSRSEARLRLLVEAAPVGMLMVGDDGRITLANPRVAEMFRYSREELVGQPVEVLVPPGARESHTREREGFFRSPRPREMGKGRDLFGVRKDGGEFPIEVGLNPIRQDDGLFVLASVFDISARKEAERLLQEGEARFRQLADAMPQIVWAARPDGYIDYYNERWYDFTGFPRSEFGQQSWQPILHPDDVQRCVETYFGCVREGRPYQIEYRFRDRRTGSYRWHLGRALPVRDAAGQVVRWFGTCTDIDDQKQAEESLRRANAETEERVRLRTAELTAANDRLRQEVAQRRHAEAGLAAVSARLEAVLNAATEISIIATDPGGLITVFNAGAEQLLGFTAGEMIGRQTPTMIHCPDEVAAHGRQLSRQLGTPVAGFEALVARARRGGHEEREWTYVRKDGTRLTVSLVVTAQRDGEGRVTGFLGVARDVTERKRSEQQILASLQEKEVLLKEIHHRVKNNLQIVSTLLALQADQTDDLPSVEMFRESRGRVRSMALIHERLYRSDNLAQVDMGEYIERLAEDLYQSCRSACGGVDFAVAAEVALLPIDVAIPCGLLLNELLTNCLKHGFPAGRDGTVTVGLRRGGDGACVLTVRDDGIGFPEGIDFRNTTSFGLQLVNMLVQQLGGEVELRRGGGTCFTVTFPISE
jgi:PAS domain S-box-containing protein